MGALSGLSANAAQLRRKDDSAASGRESCHCGNWLKLILARRKPLGGGGVVQAAASNSTAKIWPRLRQLGPLLRQFPRGRHQHPVRIGGIQVALESPDIGDIAAGKFRDERDGDFRLAPVQR